MTTRAGEWLHDEITDWAANGLTDVDSLLEDHEVRELELTREGELLRQAGLDFERFPIPDRGISTSLQLAHDLWRRLEVKLRNERRVGNALPREHRARGFGRGWNFAAPWRCGGGGLATRIDRARQTGA